MKRGGRALPSPPLAAAAVAVAVAIARRAADKASHDEDDNDGGVPALATAAREAVEEAAVDVASAPHQRWRWRKGAAPAVTLFRAFTVVVNIITCGDAINPPRSCGAARRDAA